MLKQVKKLKSIEETRKELDKKLAATAKEKEDVRRKLVVTAKELAATAKEKEDVRRKLVVTAKEKEDVRRELAITAKKLAAYTTGLEIKEVARTAELVERVKELESLNATMIGRELRMIELKEEIKRLKDGNHNL